MRAVSDRFVDRTPAVLKDGSFFERFDWPNIGLVLLFLQERRLKEGCRGVQNRRVAGHGYVVADRVRKPEQIVRTAATNAGSGWLMPPMLYVSLGELPRSGPQNHFARGLRRRVDQGQGILQLIPEAVGSARLIQRRTAPDTTAQGLIEQPAIHQEVDGKHRSLDLNGSQQGIPPFPSLLDCLLHVAGIAIARQ